MNQLLIFSILIIFAIGLFFGATVPLLEQISTKKEERQALTDIVGRFNDIRKVKNDLIGAYNLISRGNVERLAEVVPNTVREDELLVVFERVAKSSGLLMKRLDIKLAGKDVSGAFAIKEKENSFSVVTISASLDGSYSSFIEFLKNLEKSLRIMDVKEFSFHVSDTASAASIYEFDIKIDAYTKRQTQ